MDAKCKNCGQFLEEKDKFCRYCGCPVPILTSDKPLPKLTKKAIEDKIQEEKTIVKDIDMDIAVELDYSLIKVRRKGELYSMRLRSVIMLIIALLFSVSGVAFAFVFKGLEGHEIPRVLGIVLSIVAIFIGFAVAIERYFMITTYNRIKERKIIVPKYGLRKTPIFMLGGYIFSMDTDIACPTCDGEIKGDLHIEIISDRAVAVCNYNRKHIFNISAESFFEYYLGERLGAYKGNALNNINESKDTLESAQSADSSTERLDVTEKSDNANDPQPMAEIIEEKINVAEEKE